MKIFKSHSWFSLLYLINYKPEMYLGSKSLKALWHFVDGVMCAGTIMGAKMPVSDFDWHDFEGFGLYNG